MATCWSCWSSPSAKRIPVSLVAAVAALFLAGPADVVARCLATPEPEEIISSPALRVLTLNLAHGRKSALNQMLVTGKKTRRNLEEVADVFLRVDAHVIGLQEADAPSGWSGGFDHVEFLAETASYPCFEHGHHADNWLFTFGAALLSRYLLTEAESHSFKPSPPTTTKGFVRADVQWDADGSDPAGRSVTMISVHLDFSRRKVRESQMAEMNEALAGMETPFVILGDFNADWQTTESIVRGLTEEFDLRVFDPLADGLGTYKKKRRFDWILLSKQLEFVTYEVLPDIVSDHLAVVAEITWATDD